MFNTGVWLSLMLLFSLNCGTVFVKGRDNVSSLTSTPGNLMWPSPVPVSDTMKAERGRNNKSLIQTQNARQGQVRACPRISHIMWSFQSPDGCSLFGFNRWKTTDVMQLCLYSWQHSVGGFLPPNASSLLNKSSKVTKENTVEKIFPSRRASHHSKKKKKRPRFSAVEASVSLVWKASRQWS